MVRGKILPFISSQCNVNIWTVIDGSPTDGIHSVSLAYKMFSTHMLRFGIHSQCVTGDSSLGKNMWAQRGGGIPENRRKLCNKELHDIYFSTNIIREIN